jgi:hypothetical protein
MEQTITAPNPDDLQRLESMRAWVRDHYEPQARDKYQSLDGKLNLLQAILDNGWIRADETLKLQCLGITLGDALAQALGLEWVMVEDQHGRDPAVQVAASNIRVFPQTLISKRIEKGEPVNVRELFDGLCERVRQLGKELNH